MDANIGVDMDSEVNMDDDAEIYMNSESDATLRVNSNGVAIVSSSQVESENDLEIFSDNLSIRENNISDVNIDTDADGATEIMVVHKNEAKLLGFIPVTVKTTTVAEVNEDFEMTVDSKVSWWSFLATAHGERKNQVNEIEENLKSNTTLTANLSANVSAQAKAEAAEAIIAELKARQNTEASAQASI